MHTADTHVTIYDYTDFCVHNCDKMVSVLSCSLSLLFFLFQNQSPPERNIKSENMEILSSDNELDKKSC